MDIKEAYRIMQKESGIEVGDTVKVLRIASDYEMGWCNLWGEEMDEAVGYEDIVVDVHESHGIKLSNADYQFPFFVLEKVKDGSEQELPESIQNVIDSFDWSEDSTNKLKELAVAILQEARRKE